MTGTPCCRWRSTLVIAYGSLCNVITTWDFGSKACNVLISSSTVKLVVTCHLSNFSRQVLQQELVHDGCRHGHVWRFDVKRHAVLPAAAGEEPGKDEPVLLVVGVEVNALETDL